VGARHGGVRDLARWGGVIGAVEEMRVRTGRGRMEGSEEDRIEVFMELKSLDLQVHACHS
jgi:hypothetical protein